VWNSTPLPRKSCWSSEKDAALSGSSDFVSTGAPSIHSVSSIGSDPAGRVPPATALIT
jgi:hypothetical protein